MKGRKFMKKRIIAILATAALGVGLLTGCGTETPSDTDENGKTTIKMWTFLDPSNIENGRSVALKQMIDEFEEENPGVEVVVEAQDWGTMTAKFLASANSGDSSTPDIIWCARDELSGVLDAGALEPLENLFLGEWTEEEIADIDDAFFKFAERDGKHYALTLNKNATVLFYREDLLEEAGLAVPETFDEIVEVATALTGTDEETGIQRYGMGMSFATENNDAQAIVNYLLQEQGDLFNEDGTANWANEAGVEGVNWTVQCIENGITPAESVNTDIETIYTEFASGKYAMSIASGVRLASLRESATFDGSTIQIAPLPGGTIIDGWFAGVWSGSQNKELAGKFIEKMYSPEADKLWVEVGGQAPCRKSTIESLEITDENRYLEVMIDAFGQGWLPSNDKAYLGWKYDLNVPIADVLTEGADPMEALQEAEENFNSENGR